jgi:hypothetical protein
VRNQLGGGLGFADPPDENALYPHYLSFSACSSDLIYLQHEGHSSFIFPYRSGTGFFAVDFPCLSTKRHGRTARYKDFLEAANL